MEEVMEEAMAEQVGTEEVPIKVEAAMAEEGIKEVPMVDKDMEEAHITIHISQTTVVMAKEDSIIQQVADLPVLIVALVWGLFAVLAVFWIAVCADMISTYSSTLLKNKITSTFADCF